MPRSTGLGTALALALVLPVKPAALARVDEPPAAAARVALESRQDSGRELPGPSSRDRAANEALERGLAWLARSLRGSVDGSFPLDGASPSLRAPVATSALATLALMAGGSLPDRGPHGEEVARAVDYLLARVQLQPGAPDLGYVGSGADVNSQMHGHGFATLALAEAFTISPKSLRGQKLARALPLAVQLIERTQGSEGGWYYKPRVDVQHEGSVTICLVQALRAARNAGVVVDPEVIERAVRYVRASQAEDGAFRYQIGSDQTSVALTAAAISTLNATGNYADNQIERGIDAIWRDLEERRIEGKLPGHPYYERFYLAQALWQNPDESLFERWYEPELQRVLGEQREDGAWEGSGYGTVYATAMQCLFLAIPLETLPIFAR